MLHRTTFALCLLPLPLLAQTDDRGYLTAFLEDNLSGAGRHVVITGFEGALSSQARIAEMTIADDAGVWLTLRDVVLDWNRAALFSGNVQVNQLTAAEIDISRMPQSEEAGLQPEAGTFNLPDLPVSIDIGRIAADHIRLGTEVLGQPVEGQFQAAMTLIDGEGSIDLLLERSNAGPEGRIALKAAYSNADQTVSIDLTAVEGAGGLVTSKLDLPGDPALELSLKGTGPFNQFAADIALSTDENLRLSGSIETVPTENGTGFSADLTGDIAPLFLPAYAEFFGSQVALQAKGVSHQDGRLDLSSLHLTAKALDLAGSLSLSANHQPQAFSLTGQIAQSDNSAVLLPLTTDLPVQINKADIVVSYDRAKGDGWTGAATVQGLDRADFRASQVILSGSGRITPGQFGATLTFDAEGLQPTDAALGAALGSFVSGNAILFRRQGDAGLSLPRLTLTGQDYSASVTGGRVAGLDDSFAMTGTVAAELADLSRFGPLADLPLGGAAKTTFSGRLEPLTGAYNLILQADGQDMRMGQPMIDAVLRGAAKLTADLVRDASGTKVNSASISANSLSANAQGALSSDATDLTAQLRFADLSVLGGGLGGTITADARMIGPFASANLQATANGQGLRMGNAQIDKLIAGDSRLSADLTVQNGTSIKINRASLNSPQLTAEITGLADGSKQTLDLKAQLRNLGLLIPEFPGELVLSGQVINTAGGAQIDLTGKGPGGIDAVITGRVEKSGQADLAIRGRGQAALANAFIAPRTVSGGLGFDLRLNGPLALSSVSGPITLEGGRLSDPGLTFGFQDISARADLAGGQAKVNATLPLTTGGKAAIAGTIGLAEPFSSTLGIALQGVTLRDPELYDSRLNGELTLTGPLLQTPQLAGQIDLIETELRVPSTGFGGAAGLPDLRHVNEPADVRATRERAGLLEKVGKSVGRSGGDLALDLTISAPNRLFLRGRGLDAELGGEVRLLGTLSNLKPAGSFNLIRGRVEILGKRLELDEATLQLEGDLVPYLNIGASTENDGVTAFMLIEGRADDPKVSFTSFPELPEEEVLAQLLFGQNLQNLSALQALQLANAVATLAGRGGEGVISRLRKGFGLDNLDLKTTDDGGAEVTAGKYIGKNVYTEVTVGQDGKSQINLNFDLSKSVTIKGKAGSDGNTGVGIFLEKDY